MKIGPCQNLWIIWDGFPFLLPNCSTGTDELTVAVLMMEWDYREDTNKTFLAMGSFILCYIPVLNPPKVSLLCLGV